MDIPVYELQIDASKDSDLEVSAVALVDRPAIEKDFIAFKESAKLLNFSAVDDEQRIVVGAAMIPDQMIYRNDQENGEYYVHFSKETICTIAEKFYTKNFQNNANLMHDPNQPVSGMSYFMSFIRDSSKGMIGLDGEYPEGTWFLGARVNNDEVWNKIKAGEVKGFSVEGVFKYKVEKPVLTHEEIYEEIKRLMENVEL
jgi:hypothetical protein